MEQLTIFSNKAVKTLNDATIISHMAHWVVKGTNFYEAHQLFGRIYSDLDGHMDGFIETLRAFGYSPSFAQFSGPGMEFDSDDCHYLGKVILNKLMTLSSVLSLFSKYCDEQERENSDPRLIGLANRIQGIADGILTDMYLLQSFLGS